MLYLLRVAGALVCSLPQSKFDRNLRMGGASWLAAQNVTFTQIYADGFRSVRIPVTYVDHYVSDAPDYTINATWLARVSYVVDAVSFFYILHFYLASY